MKTDRTFEVVRASAGSGKTHRLVGRYLSCCLKHADPRSFRQVLALTFTNKAAWEMKERILEELEKLGTGKASEGLLKQLTKETQLTEDVLRQRALAMRSTMLHRYGEIAVMTLDSFTNRLVKSFARDLALDQDYRIELDQERIIDEAVGQLLDKIGEPGEEELTSLLKGFARMQVEDEKDSRVRHPLQSFGKEVLKENMRRILDELSTLALQDFKSISQDLRRFVRLEEDALRASVREALDVAKNEGITSKEVAHGDLLNWLNKNRLGHPNEVGTRLEDMFAEGVFTSKKAPKHVVASVEKLRPFAEKAKKQVEAMTAGTARGEAYLLRSRLLSKIDLIGTLAVLSEEIESVQQVQNVRLFQALHERVARVVRHNPVPFLFERMGSRYRHVFVDEFQDTSITQWQNLIPLVDHVLSERHRALVVGDGKQAIYRWRNGDYRQLVTLPEIVDDEEGAFSDAENTFHDTIQSHVLESNWRSGRAIVHWNNRFFERMKGHLPESLREVYADVHQVAQKGFEGQVHVEAISDAEKSVRSDTLNQAIARRIRHHESADGGGFKWSDMVVLVRTNKEGGRIAQHLLNVGITPQTDDSLQIGRHPAALAVVHLTRWVLDPTEDQHVTAWLQCVAAMDPDRIDESEQLDAHVQWSKDELGNTHRTFHALAMIQSLFPGLRMFERAYGPLVGWVGHLCQELGVTGRFDAYAEALMELAMEVTGAEDSGLRGFVRKWDRNGKDKSIVASSGLNAVRVMTVHQSKGLAFPVTMFVAGTNKLREVKGPVPVLLGENIEMPAALLTVKEMEDTELSQRAEEELDAAMLDQLNIVYVAMTRPIERLDVFAETPKLDFDRSNPSLVSQLVLSCAEDIAHASFGTSGDSVQEGQADRAPFHADPFQETMTTSLVLGEQVAQQVVMAPPHANQVHPGTLNRSELGTLLHDVLAQIDSISDWPQVRLQLESNWALSSEDRKTLTEWVDAALNHSDSAAFFAQGLRVEREPEWMDEHGLIRPDRVVFDGETWHVIDFKSGAEHVQIHAQQVQRYVAALRKMESQPVRGWLLYLDPWRLQEVIDDPSPLIFDAD